ncbi:hypothetical protein V6N12_038201 [Hibiscus sabdariffa]|uniref:Uncharacterized protein n=1 Tax=Hibiscus sabdariffa TaxID=183260 RepID=A0ABR2BXC3_9ROSI
MSLPFEAWFMSNLWVQGQFVDDSVSWEYLFPVICWLLWKRRCSILLDPHFVERGDVLLLGRCLFQDYRKAAETRVLAGSRGTGNREERNAIVDEIQDMLNRDWNATGSVLEPGPYLQYVSTQAFSSVASNEMQITNTTAGPNAWLPPNEGVPSDHNGRWDHGEEVLRNSLGCV